MASFADKEWAFSKFSNIRHVPTAIRELGNLMVADTGKGEMHHKPLKWAYLFTNKHGDFSEVFGQVPPIGSGCQWVAASLPWI